MRSAWTICVTQVGEATFATLWDEGQIAPLADIVEAATTLSAP